MSSQCDHFMQKIMTIVIKFSVSFLAQKISQNVTEEKIFELFSQVAF